VGVALPVADVRVDGDVAALGVAEAVPVEEAQVPFLGILGRVGTARRVKGVVHRQEDGRLVVGEGGDVDLGLEEPVGVTGVRTVRLPVHEGQFDDAEVFGACAAGVPAYLHVEDDGVAVDRHGAVGAVGHVDVHRLLDGLTRPDPACRSALGGLLGLGVASPSGRWR
jgi:hypothetical protein